MARQNDPPGSTQPEYHWIPEILTDPPHPLEAWFEDFRAERKAARDKVPAGAKRSRAIVTMVHNEPVFFPIWLRYYSRFFGPGDMYVLDHDTDDGSTDGDGFVRIPMHREDFDNEWQVATMEAKQRELLETYDVVVVVDVDELIVPTPSRGDLGEYLDRFDEPFVSCLGYEIVHLPDREPPLDPGRPILEQRRFWTENATYNKSSITTEPAYWHPGFHRRRDGHFRGEPDLRLIHLHRVDYEMCLARHKRWAERDWSNLDMDEDRGFHNRIAGGEEFDRWFFTETGFEGFPLRIEEIPAEWRGAF